MTINIFYKVLTIPEAGFLQQITLLLSFRCSVFLWQHSISILGATVLNDRLHTPCN